MELIKEEISKILNIQNTNSWNIIDSIPSEDLYLVHYNDRANMEIYGGLRGVIVDIKEKKIVCRSNGNTISITCDNIVEDKDVIKIDNYILNKNNIKIMIGFEGTMLRIFKHRGTVYFSTHRKINCVNSKWGNSISFSNLPLTFSFIKE